MYETYYGFKGKPFQLNPDPSFFYGSRQHRRAMAYLEYGVHQNEGFIVVTGEVGAGKTTIVRNLLEKLDPKQVVAGNLVSTQLDADDTLRLVASSFGLRTKDVEKSDLLLALEAFLVSLTTVGIAEMGDRTQLLSLVLAARYRRPWPILAGVLCATLANHLLAGLLGVRLGRFLTPALLDAAVGISMIGMALWALKPDKLQESGRPRPAGAFVATLVAFFIAEIGDKTQIATVALAAAYSNLGAVVAGTTAGMLLANAPVVFLGKAFSDRLPLTALHRIASALFLILGALFIYRALGHTMHP